MFGKLKGKFFTYPQVRGAALALHAKSGLFIYMS